MKNVLFALLCLSGRSHRVMLIFKNTKNSFLSLLVSVRSLASYDTCFQIIQKHQKIYKILKIQNINIFQLFLELRDPWFSHVRYVGARSVLVRFTFKKSNRFLNHFPNSSFLKKLSFKELRNPDFSFEWEYVGPRSILVGPKNVKIFLFLFNIIASLFLGEINILKTTSTLHF